MTPEGTQQQGEFGELGYEDPGGSGNLFAQALITLNDAFLRYTAAAAVQIQLPGSDVGLGAAVVAVNDLDDALTSLHRAWAAVRTGYVHPGSFASSN